jgi:lysozyme family protein
VTVDGEIGPKTLSAVGARSVADLLDDYAEARRRRYRALPHFWRFGRGWLRRVDATLALAHAWAAADGTNRGLLEPAQIAKGETSMDSNAADASAITSDDTKWWAHSKTVWGTIITAAATVIPVIGPVLGISLPADIIQTFGDQAVTAVQAIAGLLGTILAIYGRLKAATPLTLRKS